MEPRRRQQRVGTTLFFVLLVLYLSTSDVGAVTREDLDGIQLVEDVTSDRTQNEQPIETAPAQPSQKESERKPRLFKSSDDEPLGMDSLTIIWYLTTFTALLGFFVVMACTEKSCNRGQDLKPPETRTCPPTPCPSYKNFAPPSYDAVMQKFHDERVFIVPVHGNNNCFVRNESEGASAQPVDLEKGLQTLAVPVSVR